MVEGKKVVLPKEVNKRLPKARKIEEEIAEGKKEGKSN
jgi:hypothetical protein